MALPADIELMETLGEGSFGRVYVARVSDGPLRRTVVLKVLKGQWMDNDEVLRRCTDEAVLLARLNHDAIVKVEQLTAWQDRPVVVMEHIQGLSLDRVLRQNGPLPPGVALEICGRVAAALDAAWHFVPPGDLDPLCVIHRDIKPSNILVSVHGAVKVLDFGTARAQFDSRQAETRSMAFGSLPYMAPECFDGRPPTPTVDVYALGATLYELITDSPLGKLSVNPREHVLELTRRLEALNPPGLQGPALDALRDLIARAVRYEASRRPSARELRDRCRELAQQVQSRTLTLDTFAEDVVARLYRVRAVLPPVPLGDSLGGGTPGIAAPKPQPPPARTGILRAEGGVMRSSRPDDLPMDPALVQAIDAVAQRVASTPSPSELPADPNETLPPGAARRRPGAQAWTPPTRAEAQGAAVGAPAPPAARAEPPRAQGARADAGKADAARAEPGRPPGARPPSPRPEAAPPEPTPSGATQPEPAPPEPALPPDAAAGRRWGRWAAAGALLALAVGAGGVALWPSAEAPTPEVEAPQTPSPPLPVAPAPQPDKATTTTEALVNFASVPKEAQVEIAGQKLRTPFQLLVPLGEQRFTVRFPDGTRGSCTAAMRHGDAYLIRSDGDRVICP